ncbi:ABC transporter ATP-binding protein [Actinomycetaceae bacterium TAE3-ERU4]|nr:ABC transporter ATP-binding protein [Actinomycetaceae bacterium TAE3-ERU4]
MTNPLPLIELKDFSFQYRAQSEPTLKNLNLRINEGERILITGPSGCGKSTLAHVINGIIPHRFPGVFSGEARVCGFDITNDSHPSLTELSRRVGTVLQDPDGQFIGITVAEDIAFSLENQQVPPTKMHEQVRAAANLVGIADKLDSSPQQLSGGQKQRVSLAGVLVEEDLQVLLCDEPLASLDPKSSSHTLDLLDSLYERTGKTLLIVEHRIEEVLNHHIDRVILMSQGRIIADLPPAELLASSLLEDNGIRSPLYVSALKYAKINPAEVKGLENLEKIELTKQQKTQLVEWAAKVPPRTPNPQGELLRVDNLNFRYPQSDPHAPLPRLVVEDVSFSIQKGQILSLCGNNGAGKSTLAKLLCGFEKPSSGEITLNGQEISTWPIARRAKDIGFVLQNPNQMISKPTVFAEVALALQSENISPEELQETVSSTLRVCGLYPYRNWPISALSFGQKKRVTIASIMVRKPKLLILDEPTAGQDWAHYTEIMQFLQKLNELGTSILLITHDMHLALEYTTSTLVLSGSKLIAYRPCSQVLTDSDLCEKAGLKTTSLFTLAEKCGFAEPSVFVDSFLAYDLANRPQNLLERISQGEANGN